MITGGAHGIGRAVADAFRREGAAVHIMDIQPGDWFVGNVSRKEDLERFAASVIETSGRVDVLVNNALPLMKGMVDCTWEEFSYALDEETEKHLLHNLRSMTDKTMIIVTHRKAALAICSRALVFSESGGKEA